MKTGLVWVGCLLAMPVLAMLATLGSRPIARMRFAALACAIAMLVCAALAMAVPALADWQWLPQTVARLSGGALLRCNQFSSVLPTLAAGLWLLTLAVTPKMLQTRERLRRAALATLFTTLTFLSENPLLLVATWTGSVLAFRDGSWKEHSGAPRHVAGGYLLAASALFAAGVFLTFWSHAPGGVAETVGLILIVVGALIRKGIFPFHAWVPAAFEHGSLGPAILFCAPQLGTYVVAVLVVPRAPVELLQVVAVLALVTAVYGAALALVQRSTRRACAYLFVSQSAMVMAGLDCTSEEALAGALILWLSSSLAFAGLARSVLVLEARRGRQDLSLYHGGYERKPLLAVTFLLLGLTCTGFPGTLGFVGEELLLGGAVAEFPLLGFLLVISGALTGLAVLRMYFSLFCGVRTTTDRLELRPAEALGFVGVVVVLVVAGLAPGYLVASRSQASQDLLELRDRIGDRSE